MKFTPLEEIDSILNSLVKFSNTNEYDFRLFKEYAEEQAKVFNMYFSKIENEDDKQKILSQLDDNFHFLIDDVVTDMLASSYDNGSIIESNIEVAVVPNVTIPDHRVSVFKENYRELIRLFKSKIKTSEKGKDKKPKYIWKSKHALSEFYKKVNNNFFEDLSLDDFFDVFTESNKMRLNAINYNQTDIGYLFDNVKPYFIDKVQANYLDWISTKVLFNGKEKEAKAISEILNFHKRKKVEYKESIDEILKSLTPFIK